MLSSRLPSVLVGYTLRKKFVVDGLGRTLCTFERVDGDTEIEWFEQHRVLVEGFVIGYARLVEVLETHILEGIVFMRIKTTVSTRFGLVFEVNKNFIGARHDV